MSKVSILVKLKGIIPDVVDEYGNIRVKHIGEVGKLGLSEGRVRTLNNFISLLKDTDVIVKETKIYIFNKYISMKGVNEEINKNSDKPIAYNSTVSKIQYDRLKLESAFGDSVLEDILYYNEDISKYERIIAEQLLSVSTSLDIKNNLVLELPEDCVNTEISDDEFLEFISIIAPYTKKQIKWVQENIDRRYIGYFNYITHMPISSKKDKDRLEMITKMLE